MKKCIYLLALLPVLLFSGCPASPTGAFIVSFDFDGIVGEAVIDTENRTVSITAVPVDLSVLVPEIVVSENAILGDLPAFEDGVPAVVGLTDQDGAVEEWTVTINLLRGISFLLDGVRVALTAGLTDTDPTPGRAEAVGDGVPGFCVFSGDGDYLDGFALNEVYDLFEAPPAEEAGTIYVEGTSPDTYTGTSICFFHYCLDSGLDGTYEIDINTYENDEATVILKNAPAVGEDLYGSFFVPDATNGFDASSVVISEGFFKLRRVSNDFNSYPDPDYFWVDGGAAD